eukprot:TRINITY_DN29943_c2_g1_i1.p1 TRINITY_DN29943_c2_g1~~TRINITY_DN29943_c2_g1_i1.p1  ORF type:complete len:585 (-),score=112.22 TRINITY_DN29943_c2_g1_i1:21-1775(-)
MPDFTETYLAASRGDALPDDDVCTSGKTFRVIDIQGNVFEVDLVVKNTFITIDEPSCIDTMMSMRRQASAPADFARHRGSKQSFRSPSRVGPLFCRASSISAASCSSFSWEATQDTLSTQITARRRYSGTIDLGSPCKNESVCSYSSCGSPTSAVSGCRDIDRSSFCDATNDEHITARALSQSKPSEADHCPVSRHVTVEERDNQEIVTDESREVALDGSSDLCSEIVSPLMVEPPSSTDAKSVLGSEATPQVSKKSKQKLQKERAKAVAAAAAAELAYLEEAAAAASAEALLLQSDAVTSKVDSDAAGCGQRCRTRTSVLTKKAKRAALEQAAAERAAAERRATVERNVKAALAERAAQEKKLAAERAAEERAAAKRAEEKRAAAKRAAAKLAAANRAADDVAASERGAMEFARRQKIKNDVLSMFRESSSLGMPRERKVGKQGPVHLGHREPVGVLSLEQLAGYGYDSQRVLLSVWGYIFDVSSAAEKYGPGGDRKVFSGKDITFALLSGKPADTNRVFDFFRLNPPDDEGPVSQTVMRIGRWVCEYESEFGAPVGRLSTYDEDYQLPPAPTQELVDDCTVM